MRATAVPSTRLPAPLARGRAGRTRAGHVGALPTARPTVLPKAPFPGGASALHRARALPITAMAPSPAAGRRSTPRQGAITLVAGAGASSPEGPAPRRAVVVGGGILGASIARQLALREGWEVTVVEAEEKAGQVATYCSWAWLNANRKSPAHYRDLNLAGMDEWAELGLADFCGCLIVDDPFPPSEAYRSDEVPRERLREQEPALSSEFVQQSTTARFFRQEGLLDPVAVTGQFLQEVEDLGGKVQYGERVEELLLGGAGGGARGVRTAGGAEIAADVVILAAGVEIPTLAGPLQVDVPLLDRPGILVHTTPQDPSLLRHIVVTNTCYLLQRPDGAVIIGEDMNGRDQIESVDTSMENARRVLAKAAKVVPALQDAEVAEVTLGRRPYPADGLPVVGPAPGVEGVYVAVTHSGVTLAPLLGRLAVDEIDSGEPSEMLAPYRPEREALVGATGSYDLQYHGASAVLGEHATELDRARAEEGQGSPEPAGQA